ncbi:twin-arginine translocase subunit TatC [Psychrobacter sanguinis]|uniref:twin-arginine translocase subunit TatC n=1 Tax=Psychrobacter sanguinis TaxID=861445 RepID=UPI001919C983|nr:twin-arginine translocase subunit TatC [Psychrobacter sanguinis]MCC3309136.1 twin-arginine translocase subunit TatC [Psychrobacter sanguinis]UEC26414.1 twin-arginine translocase subunit TatC [Psychrobacter sanguinis]
MSLFKKKKQRFVSEHDDRLDTSLNDNGVDSISDAPSEEALADMPLTEHLVELRMHLIKIMVVITVIFLALVGFSRELYDIISEPLVEILPTASTMIAIDPVANFMAPIRLTLLTSAFFAMPFILYQIWAFVAPGLYKHEKRIAVPILLSSIVLFYTGVAFAYFIVLKRALSFLITFSPSSVVPMTDIESYLSFVTKLLMMFGFTFEIPVVVLILVVTGLVSVASLADKRRYVIVGCFAAAGVMSPPDVPSMFLLAIPMILLFELGLLFARLLVKEKKAVSEEEADSEEA